MRIHRTRQPFWKQQERLLSAIRVVFPLYVRYQYMFWNSGFTRLFQLYINVLFNRTLMCPSFGRLDFSLSANRDLDFYRVYFQGYTLTLFRDTLDETLHCGRYPVIVQSRVHSMINLYFRSRKAVMCGLKRAGERKPPSDKMTQGRLCLAPTAYILWI